MSTLNSIQRRVHDLLLCHRGCTQIQRCAFNRVNRTNRCACFRLRCRRRHRARNWTSNLLIPSKAPASCLTCLSPRFPFQENSIVLDSVAAVALPSNPSVDDLFSHIFNTDLESSARSLVLVTLHHIFLLLSLCHWS